MVVFINKVAVIRQTTQYFKIIRLKIKATWLTMSVMRSGMVICALKI